MNQPKIPVDLILAKLAEDAEKAQERVPKGVRRSCLGQLDYRHCHDPL